MYSVLDEAPNGLELSCPAEAGELPLLYGTPAGQASSNPGPARRVSFSELFGGWDDSVTETGYPGGSCRRIERERD
jgi:hypothetical protein